MRAAAGAALLGVLLALAPAPAAAIWPFTSKGAVPTAPEPAAGSSIPAPEVAQRAEEAGKVLRDLEALLAPGAGIVAIQDRLPEIEERLAAQGQATDREVDGGPTVSRLEALASQWQSARAEVATYVNVLGERATALERGLQRLTAMREQWNQARTDARASRAPAPVVDRIAGILTSIDQTRGRLQQERAAMLVLQDRVARQVERCDEALTRIAAAREEMAERLLARDGAPLWQAEQFAGAVTGLPGRLAEAVKAGAAETARVAALQQVRIYVSLALFAALAFLNLRIRRVARGLVPAGAVAGPLAVLERPVAAALLVMLLANGLTSPQSRSAPAVGELLVLLPALLIARIGLDPHRLAALRWLGILLVVDFLRRFCSAVPLLEQQVFLLEVVGVLVVLAWTLSRGRLPGAPAVEGAGPRPLSLTALGVLAAALVSGTAAATGYMRLGLFIGGGILGGIFVALALYAALRVIAAYVAVGLSTRPLRDLRMVEYHRPLLERRAAATLRVLVVIGWVVLMLRHFGLWSSATAATQAVLGAEVQRGALSLSVGGVAVFVITVIATFLLSALVRFVLEEELYPRLVPGRPLPYAISTLVHYSLVVTGFMLGLAVLGVDLTKITIVAGALGVGIGFGLQGLVNNFVSGMVILYERRINVGDAVQVGDVMGQVQQMGLRACTVRTWEGAEVIVPNATLTADKVVNWTLSDRRRRIDLKVGVAYGTAPERLADVLLAVARKHSHVLAEPAPVVFFQGFGDSALLFEMRVWTNRFDDWVQIRSELTTEAYAALRGAAIEIPVPHHDVHVRPA
jgi:small-conductance mechanosensitive channel